MPRNLWTAREERTADDERHVRTNRARREARRCEVRQRAQDTMSDQARERRQRRPARGERMLAADAKPESEVHAKRLRRKDALTSNAGIERRRSRPLG